MEGKRGAPYGASKLCVHKMCEEQYKFLDNIIKTQKYIPQGVYIMDVSMNFKHLISNSAYCAYIHIPAPLEPHLPLVFRFFCSHSLGQVDKSDCTSQSGLWTINFIYSQYCKILTQCVRANSDVPCETASM